MQSVLSILPYSFETSLPSVGPVAVLPGFTATGA